jgi:hypothetical protein
MSNVETIQSLVKKGTRKLNRFFYVGVVIGIVMGLLPLIASRIPAVRERMAPDDLQWMTIFGAVMTVLFGIAIAEQLVKYGKDRALVWRLRHSPRDVVWAYKEISEGRVQHRTGSKGARVARFVHICVHMIDGKKVIVWLSEEEADRLLALLKATFSHLSIGYSKEIEEDYKQAPESLRLNPRQVEGIKRSVGGVRI